ncbi:MAG: peroxiredoxin family protein [Flavobacteriaceae bacterium]
MTKKILLIIICFGLFCCTSPKKKNLKEGSWRATLDVMDGAQLPFNFDLSAVEGGYTLRVFNADEEVFIDDVELKSDSIIIRMPVFEGYIAGTFSEESITGNFIKESLDRVVPFKATFGEAPRFKVGTEAKTNISGIWQTTFSADTEDMYIAKGIFTQRGNEVTGTFRTTTGDYRYLEGVVDGDSLSLSTFDGAHAFLFTGRVSDSSLVGTFYSGNHFKEPFVGTRNEHFELPDENSLTFIKEGYEKFEFSCPDASGKEVSLSDPEFQNKVVVVQIMGTWCPNCLDESKFLVNYLEENKDSELEVIALAFEYARTKEDAFKGIQRLRDRIGVEYPIVLAQYGTSNKTKANEKLPMLNHILSYPTTIFVDKKGAVRKIHTGFNGPATGEKYTEFKRDFTSFVEKLLAE